MFFFHTCNIFRCRNACSLQIDDASCIVIMKVDMEMMFYIRIVFCNWAFFHVFKQLFHESVYLNKTWISVVATVHL
jgi:hypothetical protein